MAADRIRAGLLAFCARDVATEPMLRVAREVVRSDGHPDAGRLGPVDPPACGLPLGWATDPTAVDERRSLVEAVLGDPAGDDRAAAAAAAVAAMASYAAARAPVFSVMAAGIEEAGPYGRAELTDAAVGSWTPPEGEVAAEPLLLVAAAIAALRAGGERVGGPAAALAGAISATREGAENVVARDEPDPDLDSLADGLSALRA